MNLISPAYANLNKKLHQDNEAYGTSGIQYAQDVMNLCFQYSTQDVLDYGCGKSTLANNLPFTIQQYDPCVERFSAKPWPADILVCTDVLEHIEPDCINDVIAHIGALTKKVAFLLVANGPALKTLEDGRNAHLIQENPRWWLEKLSANLDVVSFTRRKSFLRKTGELFQSYIFIAQPYDKECQS